MFASNLNRTFDALVGDLEDGVELVRPLPVVQCLVFPGSQLVARVRATRSGTYAVDVGSGFIDALHASVNEMSDELLGRMLRPGMAAPVVPEVLAGARRCLVSLAERFLLHHELAHILCGHLAREHAAGDETLAIDELSAAEAFSDPAAMDPGAREESLFRELEADGTALQALCIHTRVPDLSALLVAMGADVEDMPSIEVTGTWRSMAFRLLLAGAMQITLLLSRYCGNSSGSHPYPAARNFGLVFALMEHYCAEPEIEENEGGERLVALDERVAAEMRAYFEEAVKPALQLVVAQVDERELLSRYASPSDVESDLIADVLLDLNAVIHGHPVRSVGAVQFEAMVRRRAHFVRRYRDSRYVAR